MDAQTPSRTAMATSLMRALHSRADPLPLIDGLLAATAIVHGLTLVTRNVQDMATAGVPLFDPFTA